MLDVTRLRILREVAARGTMAAAAEALGFTASAISQQLAKLEREVGAPVLERHGRNVRPTEAGRVLVREAGEVLARLEQAEQAVDVALQRITGPLRVGAFQSAAKMLAAPAFARLNREHPDVETRLYQLEDRASLAELQLGRLDLVLGQEYTGVPADLPAAVERHPVMWDPMRLFVPRSAPDPGSVSSLADLADRHWIAEPARNVLGRALRHACRTSGFEPDIRHQVEDFDVLVALVAAGLGVGLAPDLAMRRRRTTGCRVGPVPGATPGRQIFAAVRSGATHRPAIAVALEAIQDQADRLEAEGRPGLRS